MKKLICILALFSILVFAGPAWAPPPVPPKPYLDTECNQAKYFPLGSLCQDTDNGKLYKGTGAAVVELATGTATGDMTLAEFDTDLDGFIDANNGGTDIDTSALTGTPYVTAGVWSVKSAANEMTALGFTANAQTLIGETFAQMQASLSIDDLITLSGVAEGQVHLSTFTGTTIADNQTIKAALQALETAAELKANIASPTFTGVANFPNVGLTVLDTDASHSLIIKPGSNLSADRILTITTGDAARTLSIEADSIVNQDLSSDANPSFSTLNLVGANALNLGSSRTIDGTVRFKSGTALNDFYHEIRGANFAANTLWILPTAVPGGSNYLLNVDADGTMGYSAPTFTSFTGGNWKVFYTDGTGVITEVALGVAGTVLMSNGATAAPTMQAPSGAGDVTSVGDCASGACNDETSDGGTYLGLYAAAGAVRLRNNAGVIEARTAADAAYADIKIGGLTITTTVTGILKATSGVVAAATAGTDYPGLAAANTFTGNNIFGDADTDTITFRSLLAGGNSRAVQITDSLATPTYATGPTELYVKGDVESGGTLYAAAFDSVLTAGNVGYVRIKEDPTNGTNFRAFSVVSALTQDLTFDFPDGNPSANQFFLLGAPSLNISTMSYGTFDTGDFVVTTGTVSIKALGVDVGQINATGSPGAGNFLRGDGAWQTVTAAAGGAATNVQYNTAAALDGEAAFTYDAATNTLNVTVNGANPGITVGDGTYTIGHTPQVYVEGILEVDGAAYLDSTLSVGDDITLSKNTQLITHSGNVGLTITSTSGTVTIEGVTFAAGVITGALDLGGATSFELPNGANPTTSVAGQVAVDTSAGAGGGIRVYTDAGYTIPVYIIGSPIGVKDPVAASDYLYMYSPYAITIRAVHYLCIGGTSWTGQIQICDANGGSCGDTQAADTTAAAGTTTNVTSFSDGTVPTSVWMALKTTSVSGSPTSITVQVDYTIDQVN